MAIILKIVITIIIAITIDYFPLVWYFCSDFDERSLKMIGMKKLIFLSGCLIASCAALFAADEQQLFDAVKSKNLSRVNMYSYANANQLFKQGGKAMTAFQLAVENGDLNIATALLVDGNADVNADYGVEPPLFIAIRNNNSKMMNLLLHHGADINIMYNNLTPILVCVTKARGNSSHILRELIKSAENNGISIDWSWQDEKRRGILHYACTGGDFNTMQNGNADIVGLLLESSLCPVTAQDVNGWTALHMAAYAGRSEIMFQFLKGRNGSEAFSIENHDGFTPIGLLIFNSKTTGRLDLGIITVAASKVNFTVEYLNPPANTMSDNGIFVIAENSDTNRVCQIFESFSKSNNKLAELKDRNGTPLLCRAVQDDWNPEIVKILLKNYRGDWKKIREGGRRGKNAIEIMRANHSEDLYQDIFDLYMN